MNFLDNNMVQAFGFGCDAVARVIVDKDVTKAYSLALKAIALFGAQKVVARLHSDLETMKAKGELPQMG